MGVSADFPDVLCRNQEVNRLVSLLGRPEDYVPQCIFICGHKSSGKSYTLMKVLDVLKVHHATVNCVEGYLQRFIFDSILSQLRGENSPGFKCDDVMDFISQLKTIADELDLHQKVVVIILEGCERMRDMSSNLLPALMRLQELSCLRKMCTVLVSNVLWDKFIPQGGLPPPIQIYFQQYSHHNILEILALDKPKNYPADFYWNYLKLLMFVFSRSCRDISELRYQAAENFAKYCEPIECGAIDVNDSSKLWKHVSPHLTLSLQMIYMRFEKGKMHMSVIDTQRPIDKHNSLSSSAKFALSFELPYYAKYLLIAAYLASYNSPKEDKRLFVKLSGKTKKRLQKNSKSSQPKISSLVVGPRYFDLERLLAIFYSITEEKPHISVNLLTQITSLVELQLLLKVGNDPLEAPRYKCAVGLDFIIIISKTLSFNVTKYLTDYK